jgi:hypothetical protein
VAVASGMTANLRRRKRWIVRECVEEEPKRVGVQGVAAEPVGRKVTLELLDKVLGLPRWRYQANMPAARPRRVVTTKRT